MINFLDLVVRKRCHLAHQGGTIVFRIGFRTIIFSNQMFDSNGSDVGYTGKPRLYYIVNGLPIFVRASSNETAISPESFPFPIIWQPRLELHRKRERAVVQGANLVTVDVLESR